MIENRNKTVIGRILPNPCGTWDDSRVYDKLDFVIFDGSGYVANVQNKGYIPAVNNKQWTLVVERGEQGVRGERGPKGDEMPVFTGVWDEDRTYNYYEVVLYQGSSWICMSETSTGDVPAAGSDTWVTICTGFNYVVKNQEIILKDNDDQNISPRTFTSTVYDKESGEKLSKTIEDLTNRVIHLETLLALHDR